MINEGGIAKVEEHIADALKRGATLVTGGKRLSGSSFILKNIPRHGAIEQPPFSN